MSVWWWLKKGAYARFVFRELTSVFVAWFALVLLWELRALASGPDAYQLAVARLQTPLVVALNVIGLAFVLFHAITWFNLAPKAMVVRVGDTRVPDWAVAAGNYGAWLTLSVAVAWVLLRG
jgi:fumarate reductase subunit C